MKNNTINFIELYSIDLDQTKQFYRNVFSWDFVDYGENYCDFTQAGISGGFAKVDSVVTGGPLVVLYHENLDEVVPKILKNGGVITQKTFSFLHQVIACIERLTVLLPTANLYFHFCSLPLKFGLYQERFYNHHLVSLDCFVNAFVYLQPEVYYSLEPYR